MNPLDRRSFLTIAGASLGVGALFRVMPASGTPIAYDMADALRARNGEAPGGFSFVQISDTHVGFEGPPNPLGTKAFERAVEVVNALPHEPDLVLFTGDLTHDSEAPGVPAQRMKRFKEIAGRLKAKNVKYVPGEHDSGLDGGVLYKNVFGDSHYSFDHKGIHFVALDNVSQGKPVVGPEQIAWLKKDVSRFSKTTPIVVFTHRPLFDLAPEWEWFTGDGDDVMGVLEPFDEVTVLYGHIHRKHDQVIGRARHHAARSLIFAFPDPSLGVDRKPVAFDKEKPFANLGVREVRTGSKSAPLDVNDIELSIREYAGNAGISQLRKGGLFV